MTLLCWLHYVLFISTTLVTLAFSTHLFFFAGFFFFQQHDIHLSEEERSALHRKIGPTEASIPDLFDIPYRQVLARLCVHWKGFVEHWLSLFAETAATDMLYMSRHQLAFQLLHELKTRAEQKVS